MKILAIIPARGGSKGIPKKNSLLFDGKTLVEYSIKSATQSKLVDKIIISSDDDDILKVASSYSNVHIHKRKKNLSGDKSPVIDTVLEILKHEIDFEVVVLLQPTSPLRTGIDIDNALKMLIDNSEINSIISVVETNDVHPARMYWHEKNRLKPILSEFENSRRQDIPIALYRNGAIYITRVSSLKKTRELMAKPSAGYIMDSKFLLNIDDQRDLVISEAMIKYWKKSNE